MEIAALIISIGGFIATAGAATVAWVQANTAIDAKKEASKSAERADELATDANRIADQARTELAASAAALAEANELTRSQLPKYPWVVLRHGDSVEVKNNSGDVLRNITFHPDEHGDITPLVEFPVDELHPNESLLFGYGKTLDSPAATTLLLKWQLDTDAIIREWRQTLH